MIEVYSDMIIVSLFRDIDRNSVYSGFWKVLTDFTQWVITNKFVFPMWAYNTVKEQINYLLLNKLVLKYIESKKSLNKNKLLLKKNTRVL